MNSPYEYFKRAVYPRVPSVKISVSAIAIIVSPMNTASLTCFAKEKIPSKAPESLSKYLIILSVP